jgi:hypothetical protein
MSRNTGTNEALRCGLGSLESSGTTLQPPCSPNGRIYGGELVDSFTFSHSGYSERLFRIPDAEWLAIRRYRNRKYSYFRGTFDGEVRRQYFTAALFYNQTASPKHQSPMSRNDPRILLAKISKDDGSKHGKSTIRLSVKACFFVRYSLRTYENHFARQP